MRKISEKGVIMSTESYGGYKFRYVHDNKSRGKVKIYVESGTTSKTQHLYEGRGGSPDYICIKKENKPSSYARARTLAHKWADMNRR